ncbi:MAG: hypothetical protein GXY67_09950 [Clostridiales bacterium]|nr:hypothetical protein [Clostridiales bacterium]
MEIVICRDHQMVSQYAADRLASAFLHKPDLTVTFAAGDTPLACYRQLLRSQQTGALRLDQALYIGLDEWVGLGPETPGSCIATMNLGYYHPAGIPAQRVIAFDGLRPDPEAEAERMQKVLGEHPLDLAVLGVGINGHVGFNEPETPLSGDFSLVPLSETTQSVGRKYFSGKPTPILGATITLQALKKARQVIIIATGAHKRDIVSGIFAERADLPVCAFLSHHGALYLFDEAAAFRG